MATEYEASRAKYVPLPYTLVVLYSLHAMPCHAMPCHSTHARTHDGPGRGGRVDKVLVSSITTAHLSVTQYVVVPIAHTHNPTQPNPTHPPNPTKPTHSLTLLQASTSARTHNDNLPTSSYQYLLLHQHLPIYLNLPTGGTPG